MAYECTKGNTGDLVEGEIIACIIKPIAVSSVLSKIVDRSKVPYYSIEGIFLHPNIGREIR